MQREHTIRSQQVLITSALHHHWAPHAQGCLPWALLTLTICHTPHRLPHTIHRAPFGPLFKKEGMLLRPATQPYGQVRTDWNQCFVIDQWWRTYGTRARGGTNGPHCGHAHRRFSAEFDIRKAERCDARLIQDRDNNLKKNCWGAEEHSYYPSALSGTSTYPACNFRGCILGWH